MQQPYIESATALSEGRKVEEFVRKASLYLTPLEESFIIYETLWDSLH